MAASVVRVERTASFTGTGFVCYSAQGRCLVMTAAEAVGTKKSYHGIGLPNQGADTCSAELLYVDKGANLALLSFVPGAQHPCAALELADWRTANLSSGAVVVRGYYHMGRGAILQAPGVFLGDIRGDAVCRGNVHTLSCDYTAADGLRGAPVIQAGRVIGVHTRSEGRLQIATSVSSVFTTVHAWLGGASLTNASIYEMLEMIAAANNP